MTKLELIEHLMTCHALPGTRPSHYRLAARTLKWLRDHHKAIHAETETLDLPVSMIA